MSGLDSSAYLRALQNLLPRGIAWTRRNDAKLTKLLQGFADELARVDLKICELLEDFDPRTTSKLEDWERVLGLPDDCAEEGQTITFRRNRIISKLVSPINGQNVQFYIDFADLFGVTLTTSDFGNYQAFVVGRGTVGSVFPDGSSDPPQRLTNGTWPYWVTIDAPAGVCENFKVGSVVGERLADCNDDEFECIFNALKPAHVEFDFNFV